MDSNETTTLTTTLVIPASQLIRTIPMDPGLTWAAWADIFLIIVLILGMVLTICTAQELYTVIRQSEERNNRLTSTLVLGRPLPNANTASNTGIP